MFLAFVLAFAAAGPAPRAPADGLVVVATDTMQFDEPLARRLCPDSDRRLEIRIGAASLAALDPLATLGTPAPRVTLSAAGDHPGDDRELAERIARVDCVVLAGGTWLEWWKTLRADNKPSRLWRAVVAAHERGATVIGVGAAGIYLGEWSLVSRVAVQRPSADPHDESQDLLFGGLSLVRGLCLDMATDGRTSPERLVEAVSQTRLERATWLAGACAWIHDERTDQVTIAAREGVAFEFDFREARRSGTELRDVSLARLVDGAVLDRTTRANVDRDDPRVDRSVQNESVVSMQSFFTALSDEKGWFSSKVVAVEGERYRAHLMFRSAPDAHPRPGVSPRVSRVRLAWIRIAR